MIGMEELIHKERCELHDDLGIDSEVKASLERVYKAGLEAGRAGSTELFEQAVELMNVLTLYGDQANWNGNKFKPLDAEPLSQNPMQISGSYARKAIKAFIDFLNSAAKQYKENLDEQTPTTQN